MLIKQTIRVWPHRRKPSTACHHQFGHHLLHSIRGNIKNDAHSTGKGRATSVVRTSHVMLVILPTVVHAQNRHPV